MAKREIPLPGMGEGVIEAVITRWLVEEGERVVEDQPLVEVATDKVDSEVVSPSEGRVIRFFHKEGDTVAVGAPLLLLEDNAPEETQAGVVSVGNVQEDLLKMPEKESAGEKGTEAEDKGVPRPAGLAGRSLSPLVRKIIREEGIGEDELAQITGSGVNGRITREDVLGWLSQRKQRESKPPEGNEEVTPEDTSAGPGDDHEMIKMDRVRRLIAGHMVESVRRAPHVTSFIEVDVTAMVAWRERVKDEFFRREGEKLTFTPLFIEAVTQTLKEMPMVNVSLEGDYILRKKHINIGMATALPDGNLIVPVIHDADRKSLAGLAREVNDLASRARKKELKPHEIQGGTFTVTNFGTFRNLTGTPIINQPESAILGVGAILKKPAVVQTQEGDAIAIRHLVILSLSYDHRIIDGALGGRFLQRLAEFLEGFDTSRSI
jgi:2-oxoglutarate dehydrogenase E2 component (dihydrolipoamide succinyltransferase)